MLSQSEVTTHLLPPADTNVVQGGVAIVIDVLRATTTIVTALEHGAERMIICGEVAAARKLASALPDGRVLLGGERGGARIDGFDLDNSPTSYERAVVGGRTIAFTTSHGTRAMTQVRCASAMFIGSFRNAQAIVDRVVDCPYPLHLVCSGTDGLPCMEDSLCAAVLAGRIWQRRGEPEWHDDATLLLLETYQAGVGAAAEAREQLLRSGRGGRRLAQLGYLRDIAIAAQQDVSSVVPRMTCVDLGLVVECENQPTRAWS